MVFNKLPETIQFIESYEDSGKIESYGEPFTLPTDKAAVWRFVKHAGSATGSNGVLVYNLPDASLTIFYENPWSDWNFAGVCIKDKFSEHPTED